MKYEGRLSMPRTKQKSDTPLPLDQMTTAAKLRTMELLWDDLCRRADEISSPLWHNEVLNDRELKMLSGESTIEDWEAAKVHRFQTVHRGR
jgi:hypothetical protein